MIGSCHGLEFKSNIISSVNTNDGFDLILNTHNTLLIGDYLKIGPYFGYEKLHSYTTDTAYGGAIRLGKDSFLEVQGGIYEREFRDQSSLNGKGYVINLLTGTKLNNTFSLTLLFSGKKINSGMDPRWIFKVLPYLGVSLDF